MSRFREELAVVPPNAKMIATAVYAVVVGLAWTVITHDPKFAGWPRVGMLLFSAIMPLFLSLFVLLIGYVYGDARRRGMRYMLWTLLALFIPNAIGIILYFILRDPLPRNCPKCGTRGQSGFAYCAACGTPLSETCPACGRAVEAHWSHCPGCGKELKAA